MHEERYMQRAIRLAKKGTGKVSPNPRVGSIIVKNGRIIGEGYHEKFGGPHAEINALSACIESPKGASLYVTLEPCCHHGKTPPCTESIIQSGIQRVVIGCMDPNPLVAGKGVEILKNAGIQTVTGVAEESCKCLIEMFSKYITQKIPFVTMKIAQTLDGKIATVTGDSKWITSEKARKIVHQMRKEHDAVLVGINTVICDDPFLNIRMGHKGKIKRIILDSRLRIPLNAKVLEHPAQENTVLVTTEKANSKKADKLKNIGVDLWRVKTSKDGGIEIQNLLKKLGRAGISSVLVEGGSKVFTSFLKARCVDRAAIFIAPKILGRGRDGVGDLKICNMSDVISWERISWRAIGDDLLFEGKPCLQA